MNFRNQTSYGRALLSAADELPILELNLIPGPESNATELSFNWTETAQKEDELSIKINFKNSTAVSINPVRRSKS
jgi:hypothetical protein